MLRVVIAVVVPVCFIALATAAAIYHRLSRTPKPGHKRQVHFDGSTLDSHQIHGSVTPFVSSGRDAGYVHLEDASAGRELVSKDVEPDRPPPYEP